MGAGISRDASTYMGKENAVPRAKAKPMTTQSLKRGQRKFRVVKSVTLRHLVCNQCSHAVNKTFHLVSRACLCSCHENSRELNIKYKTERMINGVYGPDTKGAN